jgi:hypothetical protein
MNGGYLTHSKRTEAGREQRLKLLEQHFPCLRKRLGDLAPLKANGDMVDAFMFVNCAPGERRMRNAIARKPYL